MSIPVTHIDGDELIWLSNVIDVAMENGQPLRISQQGGHVMFSRGASAWSPKMGEDKTV